MDASHGTSRNGLEDGAVARPNLREPQGWRYLEDHELASRLSVLLEAGLAPRQMAAGMHAGEPPSQSAVSMSWRSNASGEEGDAPLAAEGAPFKALESSSDAVRQWARISLALPVLALAISLGLSAPLLVWAPLLGGLCLGLAALQLALVRRWRQQWLTMPAQGTVAFDSAVLNSRPRAVPTGVLLAGFLSIFGLLAAIVLYTAAIRNRDTAAMAQIHASQPPTSPEAQGQNPGRTPLLPPEADHEPQHRSHP